MVNPKTQDQQGKTNKIIEACRPEGCITDPMNTRTEETSWGQRGVEEPSEGGQALEGAVAPHIS